MFNSIMKGYVVVVCVALYGLAECSDVSKSHLPELTIMPCRNEDTACLIASAQAAVPLITAGVPSMGIAVLDPMHVEQVKTTQAGLEVDFRNTSVTGLKHCRVLMLTRYPHKTILNFKCSVTLVGDYTLGGRLLIMPIEGSGRYIIKIRDIVVNIHFPLGEKTRNGEQYWVLKNWHFTSEVEKGAHFRFKNLFNGNKELSDAVHQFANGNWRDIFQEVAPPIVKAIVSKLVVESTKVFDKVPINKLVIE